LIGIVIVAHGGLAPEYLSAVEHVVGPQDQMCAIAIEPGHDRAEKQADICRAADSVDAGDGVVVVTDIFGGSPSNLSLLACSQKNRAILYGANLPMLVKLAKSRHLTVTEAVAAARDAGRRYINSLDISGEAPRPNTSGAAIPAPLPPCAVQPIRPADETPRRQPGKLASLTGKRPRGGGAPRGALKTAP